MASRNPLCLRCRGSGHVLAECQSTIWQPENSWMFDDGRMTLGVGDKINVQPLCSRCSQLDVLAILDSCPPWTTQDELNTAFEHGSPLIRSIGLTGTIQFWEDCALCRCLFALTPNPASHEQEIFLVPDWTICRISGETGIDLDAAEKLHYGTCLTAALKPSTLEAIPLPIRVHRGDAICLLDEDLDPGRTLGGRLIRQDRLDCSLVQQWISSCGDQHGDACRPQFTPALGGIHLVDVESREIIQHPGVACDYVALSYVWGAVEQPSFKVGDRLPTLPQTLEDSIQLTRRLGKMYLWADSLCIDQGDHNEKEDQIQKMRDIYHGAWVTVIAISGESANAGLPRVSHDRTYPQLTCTVNGKRLVGLMPTLSQQVWSTLWGQRAWTFQESRLSPRCLLISDHQLYFECKGFQCVESLEIKRSWVHRLSVSANTTSKTFASWMMAQGGSGCFRHSVDMYEHRLNNYGCGLNLYSTRQMKYAEDCVKAFTGMLQTFDKVYPKGFIEGLPIEDLNWGLVWTLRDPAPRRPGFPSWTWAGWDGAVWYGQPIDHTKPRRCSLDLGIYCVKDGEMRAIFHTSTTDVGESNDISMVIRNDPIDKAQHNLQEEQRPVLSPGTMKALENARALILNSNRLTFILDFGRPLTHQIGSGLHRIFEFHIQNVRCLLRIMSTDQEISRPDHGENEFLLIARDFYDGFIVHYLLLVSLVAGDTMVVRKTNLDVFVPMGRLDVLEEFNPRKEWTVLL